MPGPLPKPADQRRRRNAPTIPTTRLPASGFDGSIPRCPMRLGKAGRAWWRWAWRTPQAAAWSPGAVYSVALRASLQDLLDDPAIEVTPTLVGRCVDLDDKLGLTPKGMAALRWEIVADEPAQVVPDELAPVRERRVAAVDPAIAAGS